MNNITIIDLLRHGEAAGGQRYRGYTDDPLTENGLQQMQAAVNGYPSWDLILSSPLSRCRSFAEELAQCQDIPLVLDDRLKEIYFGKWEGKTAGELMQTDKDSLLAFWADPVSNTPQDAEALTDFRDRVLSALEEFITRYAGKHVLLVGHAGFIRMILHHVICMPLQNIFRIEIPHACLTRISVTHNGETGLPTLVFHGVHQSC